MPTLVLLGEAWGEQEERERAPFVGPTGYELTKMLGEAGIHRADCFLTNVLNLRPPANKIDALCGVKENGIIGYPALVKGKYLNRRYQPELERLAQELSEVNPNLIVCLGNTAAWALLGRTAITKLRGTTFISTHTVTGFKVLPTYHPAAIFRQWELRPVAVIDLQKAARERDFPEIRRPEREIWIEPSIEDLWRFHELYVKRCRVLAVDIETAGFDITCVGFGPSERCALVIPFYDSRKRNHCYWPTPDLERQAWAYIRGVCEGDRPKVFQNGLYDIAFLYRAYGIRVKGAEEDTMLLHHALQPESLKSLGFLGSVYTDEGSWKWMRERRTTIKRED